MKDSDTLMMAGLITNVTADEEQKVPILGDIPLVGDYLFNGRINRSTGRSL